jgi:hypothetical protein
VRFSSVLAHVDHCASQHLKLVSYNTVAQVE